ncbi:MAG TPA: HEAT repeat domain-containing protein [Kofleriaceae bacterium]|nr:HEAT repeat domain-containing protein [Kofleriaceae bacterium]
MKKLPLALAVLVGLVVSAAGNTVMLSTRVQDALTQLDALPSSAQLNSVHGSAQAALDNLRDIAGDDTIDPGVKIRAVRALPQYCDLPCSPTHEAHVALTTLVTTPRFRDARSGSDVLILRAGIESLGVLRVPEDVDLLVPQLSHPSRDLRAAAAHALRDLGNPAAIDALRARFVEEQVPQVSLAISDALRVLGQPNP